MSIGELEQRVEKIREILDRVLQDNAARDHSLKIEHLEDRVIPDLEHDIDRLKQDHAALAVITKNIKHTVDEVPATVDTTVQRRLRHLVVWPGIGGAIAVVSFIFGLIATDDLKELVGRTIVEGTLLDKVMAETLVAEEENKFTNELTLSILRIIETDIRRKQVLALDKTFINYLERQAEEPEDSSALRWALLRLVDTDLRESSVINIKELLEQKKGEPNFTFFHTPLVVDAVNEYDEKLSIFDNRVSVAFYFSDSIRYEEKTTTSSTLFFPTSKRNDVYVRCTFDFQKGSTIPKRIAFQFEDEDEPLSVYEVPAAGGQRDWNFTISRSVLGARAEESKGGIQKLRIIVPPSKDHARDNQLAGLTSATDETRSPDLAVSCFVNIIGDSFLTEASSG